MQNRYRAAVAAALLGAAAVAAAPALAHHGWGDYGEAEFQLSGVVERASLGGPHGLLKVRAAGGVWDVVLAPPRAIERSGLTAAAVPAGTRVTARCHRHNDGKRLEMKTERLVIGGRTYDLYPSRP
jgi:hypothetical protein